MGSIFKYKSQECSLYYAIDIWQELTNKLLNVTKNWRKGCKKYKRSRKLQKGYKKGKKG